MKSRALIRIVKYRCSMISDIRIGARRACRITAWCLYVTRNVYALRDVSGTFSGVLTAFGCQRLHAMRARPVAVKLVAKDGTTFRGLAYLDIAISRKRVRASWTAAGAWTIDGGDMPSAQTSPEIGGTSQPTAQRGRTARSE